jgi:ribose transport system substrate-binding protein
MLRKASLILGASALAIGLAACASEPAAPAPDGTADTADGARLAYFVPLQNGFTQASLDGATEAAAERGARIETVFTANGDLALQINQIEDAITSGKFDGFLIHPYAPQVLTAIEEAIDAGIPVGIVEASLNAEDVLDVLAPPGAAITASESLSDRVEGLIELTTTACGTDACEVGFIMGIGNNPLAIGVLNAYKAGLAEFENIQLVATGEGMYDTATARTAAADMLSANPGIRVLVTDDDSMTRGAELAAGDAGRDDLEFVSVGASTIGCEAVAAERWVGTTNSVPRTSGELAATGVLDMIEDPSKVDQVVSPLESTGLGVATLQGATDCPAQWGQ